MQALVPLLKSWLAPLLLPVLNSALGPTIKQFGLIFMRERLTRRVAELTLRHFAKKAGVDSTAGKIFLAAADELAPPELKCKVG